MTDSQLQPTYDVFFERFLARYHIPREKGLKERWDFLRRRPTTTKIFYLLLQQGEMYQTQIARAIERTDDGVHQALIPLRRREIVEVERRGRFVYFRLRPSAIEQYQQLLESHQLDLPEQ